MLLIATALGITYINVCVTSMYVCVFLSSVNSKDLYNRPKSTFLNFFLKVQLILKCVGVYCFSVCSSFYADFGPFNLAMLYRYCSKLNKKLKVGDIALRLMEEKTLHTLCMGKVIENHFQIFWFIGINKPPTENFCKLVQTMSVLSVNVCQQLRVMAERKKRSKAWPRFMKKRLQQLDVMFFFNLRNVQFGSSAPPWWRD